MRAFLRAPLTTPACRVDPGPGGTRAPRDPQRLIPGPANIQNCRTEVTRNCRDQGGCGGAPARPGGNHGPPSCFDDATVEGAARPPRPPRGWWDTETGGAPPKIPRRGPEPSLSGSPR